MLIGGFISISLSAIIHSIPLIILSFFIFIISPIVFNKPLSKLFFKEIHLIFEERIVRIEILNFKTKQIERDYQFSYEDIKSCILSSTSARTSTIKIFFYHSNKFQCSFTDESKEIINKDNNLSFEVYRNLYFFNNRITLLPPFYASKNGKTALIVLTIIMIIAITENIVYKPQAIPFSLLIGAVLFLQIIARRKRDIEIYNKQISG